jgi:hypothetical protein
MPRKGGVARIRPSVDPGAVIGGPHHERVLVDAELADRLHHLARIVVELHQGVEIVAAAGRLSLPARGGVVWVVHLEETETHEEGIGILGVRLQPVDGLGPHLVVAG